jgi:hypothetical protein
MGEIPGLTRPEERGATLSLCGRYRYSLWRRWDFERPAVLFVMLNPSTADAEVDDPTIRRCIGFARGWGAGGLRVCNLYAWRATDPSQLACVLAPVGEQTGIENRNDAAIAAAASDAGRIVAAWGASSGPLVTRPSSVLEILARHGRVDVEALALTFSGAPRHPLYVRADVEPVVYAKAVPREEAQARG